MEDVKQKISTKEKFLTTRSNNWLSLGLGLPTLIYAIIVLSTSILSEFEIFIGMMIMGPQFIKNLFLQEHIQWPSRQFFDEIAQYIGTEAIFPLVARLKG